MQVSLEFDLALVANEFALLYMQEYFADSSCSDVYTVESVRQTIRLARGRELSLPGKPQYDACESFIAKSINECVKQVQDRLEELVGGSSPHSLLNTIPSRFKLLRERAREIIDGLVVELGALAWEHVHDLCCMQKRLFTLNETAVSTARTEFITAIKELLDKEDAETKLERLDDSSRLQFTIILQRIGIAKEQLLLMAGVQ